MRGDRQLDHDLNSKRSLSSLVTDATPAHLRAASGRRGEAGEMQTLARLMTAGLPHAVFGFGTDPVVTSAEKLADRGARLFDDSSPACAVIMTNDAPSVTLLLGAIAAGVTLVSVPPPRSRVDAQYSALVRDVLEVTGARELIATDEHAAALSASGIPATPHSKIANGRLGGQQGSAFELIQFSSGSTARPHGIALSDAQLGANVTAILGTVLLERGDSAVSWLPLSHDMGLIGMVLTPLVAAGTPGSGRSEVRILTPPQFLRRPSTWFDAITNTRATVTTAPDFGYRHCLDHPPRGDHDLSTLRFAIAGSEMIRASTLTRFAEAFATDGFRATAFCPAYGLAEVGLAASITPEHELWSRKRLVASGIAHRIVTEAHGADHPDTVDLVSCGPPVDGYEVRSTAADGEVGPLMVRGPSIGSDPATGASLGDEDGWLRTGDLGFVADSRVFVTGRWDDHLIASGRLLHAPTVELAASAVPGVRGGRVATVALPSGEWVVVFEADRDIQDAERLASVVWELKRTATAVTGASPDAVEVVPKGFVPYTTSGKLQRRELLARFISYAQDDAVG